MVDSTVKHNAGKETISMKIANRQATADRESQLCALEAFVNIGETPDDWKRFRLKCREFFPEHLSEWFYLYAEEWAKKLQAHPEIKTILKPPLLYYRDRLRRVWTQTDPNGANLKLLLGFEREVSHRVDLERHSLLLTGTFFWKKGRSEERRV